jgi:hypothetical protein
MLNWLKRTLGIAPASKPLVLEKPVAEKPAAKPKKTKTQKPKTTTKKAAPKKKAAKVDLAAMKKDELLAHAKKSGVKVNASMKKADVIAAITAG